MLNFFKPYIAGAFFHSNLGLLLPGIWEIIRLSSLKTKFMAHDIFPTTQVLWIWSTKSVKGELGVSISQEWSLTTSLLYALITFLIVCQWRWGSDWYMIALTLRLLALGTSTSGTTITSLDFYFHLDCGMIIPFYFVSYL